MAVKPAKEVAKLRPHKFAAEFRELDEGERLHMTQSLDQYGFDSSIPIRTGTLPNRKRPFIVDGIQRLGIAVERDLDVEVTETAYKNDKEIVAEIFRLNLARRHLSTKERTGIAAIAVREGGFSIRAAAEEAGVDEKSVRNRMKNDSTAENSADEVGERLTGKDGRSRPSTKRTREEQRIWDIQADHLASETSNKEAAERLGVAASTITAARKRVTKMADAEQPKLPTAKDDPLLRTLSSAWKNFSRIEDPEEQFKLTFLAGVRAGSTATATAWTQAFTDWQTGKED